MAKSHASIKKRNKELARQEKQERKRQRKLEKLRADLAERPDDYQDDIEDIRA